MSIEQQKKPPQKREPGAPAITADYERPTGVRHTSVRPKLLLLAGSDSSELQTLLRQRLRWIATAAGIVSALSASQKLVSLEQWSFARASSLVVSWPDLLIAVLYTFAFTGLAIWLWSRTLPSLAALRVCELVIFGGGLISATVNNWYVLTKGGWLGQLLALGHLNLLATALSMNWFFLIVAYGTLIPNSGRRCAAVVVCMALLALGLTGRWLASNSVSQQDTVRFLWQMSIFLFLGVGIAIIGSHRLEILRQAASAARRLGQYQLKERLGEGGMGEVFLGEHMLLRRPCAVKLIRPERAGDAQTLMRFEREVQATATLSHPNTVQIYDYGHADDGTFYYAMEYLPGLTLEQLVEQYGPLSPARAIHFLRQVCGSLSEAHGIGLIHRDIKPANVMICRRGGTCDVAKLLDFGLARNVGADQASELTRDGMLTGTPAYMSPEQAAGEQDLDPRSDLYNVGTLGYFLLTGRTPFAGRSLARILAAQQYESPPSITERRTDVPRDLEAVIMRCLAKSPADRFADAASLAQALAACNVEEWTSRDADAWWQDPTND